MVNADQTIAINGTRVFPISIYLQSDCVGVKPLGANAASRPFCPSNDASKKAKSSGWYLRYTAGSG